MLRLLLPADAVLELNGTRTKSTGAERTVTTPPLVIGKQYSKAVKPIWKEAGKDVMRETTVSVHAGNETLLDWRPMVAQAEPGKAPQMPAAKEPDKPAPWTAEQREKRNERDRLWVEADKLRSAGKLAEAIAAAEKMLAIDREVLGMLHAQVVGSRTFLAGMHERCDDFPAARKRRQEVLAIQTRVHGEQHWQVTDARLVLADLQQREMMTAADRGQLVNAAQRNCQVVQPHQQGKGREAVPLAQ